MRAHRETESNKRKTYEICSSRTESSFRVHAPYFFFSFFLFFFFFFDVHDCRERRGKKKEKKTRGRSTKDSKQWRNNETEISNGWRGKGWEKENETTSLAEIRRESFDRGTITRANEKLTDCPIGPRYATVRPRTVWKNRRVRSSIDWAKSREFKKKKKKKEN